MNTTLETLAAEVDLGRPESEELRLLFGLACILRTEYQREEPEVIECLQKPGRSLRSEPGEPGFREHQHKAERLANPHRGTKSIDGCGHTAVSASDAVAKAINGTPLEAASYAAYAQNYADGDHAAAAMPEAFASEISWQDSALSALVASTPSYA